MQDSLFEIKSVAFRLAQYFPVCVTDVIFSTIAKGSFCVYNSGNTTLNRQET